MATRSVHVKISPRGLVGPCPPVHRDVPGARFRVIRIDGVPPNVSDPDVYLAIDKTFVVDKTVKTLDWDQVGLGRIVQPGATERRQRIRSVCCARVKAERERLGMTQRAVAATLDIKPGSYDQYERDSAPGMPTLIDLVNKAGFDPALLLGPLPDDLA